MVFRPAVPPSSGKPSVRPARRPHDRAARGRPPGLALRREPRRPAAPRASMKAPPVGNPLYRPCQRVLRRPRRAELCPLPHYNWENAPLTVIAPAPFASDSRKMPAAPPLRVRWSRFGARTGKSGRELSLCNISGPSSDLLIPSPSGRQHSSPTLVFSRRPADGLVQP